MYPRRFREKSVFSIPDALLNSTWGWADMGREMERRKGTLEQEKERKASEERRSR
jgi:hypothetical protein